jgi:glycosyltransferase involved in cell wall biosynthesis
VVLHDFYLGHLIAALDQKKNLQGIWADELYRSEGYNSLIKKFIESNVNESVIKYPVNSTVVHRAQGIILHNNYSLDLARLFFGEETLNHFAVVPLGKTINSINNKEKARNLLGIPPNAIVICSFGFLGPNKLSQDIFDAWKHTFIAESNVYLYFVGERTSEIYCSNLQSDINVNDNNKVGITGYVDSNIYENYLCACDIAIQLRVNSRGETSAALLDCMGAGLATIVLNHGPFAELPDDCVYKLGEDVNVPAISAALSLLANNSKLRSDLGNNAKNYIETEHNFTDIIKKYVREIERFSINAEGIASPEAIYSLAKKLVEEKAGEERFLLASTELANSFKFSYLKPQLLIDISALIKEDLNSGVQRYTKSQLVELFSNPPMNTRVEPIYLDEIDGKCFFRYANNFTLKLLGISDILLPDAPVVYGGNDVYYMPDLCYWSVQKCEETKIYSELKALGIKLYFVAFDILPITIPDFFPPGASSLHTKWLISILRNAAGIICISQVTKNENLLWI